MRGKSRTLLAAVVAVMSLSGCAGAPGGPAEPSELRDPCALITDELLARLAPGAPRVPTSNLGEISGSMMCEVDLESGTGPMRGDLAVAVAVDGVDMYDDTWRAGRCAEIGSGPSTDGPGDLSCVAVTPWTGTQTRIDGYAWIGDDFQARVAYQLAEPSALPAGAENDLRGLLAAAVDSLPA